VPGQPFYFKLEFAGDGVSEGLLDELASQVLRHVGCSPQQLPEIQAALDRAAAAVTAAGRCDLRLRLEHGALKIDVSSEGGPLLQSSHPIADRS
jgi:hypothetical protein